MRTSKFYIDLTDSERDEIVSSLIKKKNFLIQNNRYADAIDDLLVKFLKNKKRKFKVKNS